MITFVGTPSLSLGVVNNQPTASLSAVISDTALTFVSAVVNWGDDQITTFTRTAKPLPLAPSHVYASSGNYLVTVTASNFASPTAQSITWSGQANFVSAGYHPAPSASTSAYIGPIMANTTGYPSPTTWSWQFGTDNACLVSSLTLLLSTARGERLMDPNFGTNMKQLIFSLSGPIVADAIFSDVQQAVSTYEPRAQLVEMDATVSSDGRVITVNAAFQSTINGQQISVSNLAVPT